MTRLVQFPKTLMRNLSEVFPTQTTGAAPLFNRLNPLAWLGLLLASLTATGWTARAADVRVEAQLVWGSNERKSPDAKHKPVSEELLKKLQDLPLKWTNYFEVKRLTVDVPASGTIRAPLSEKCALELKMLDRSKIEVTLFGNGKEVLKRSQALPKTETLILGGNAPGATSWFVVLRRIN